MEDVWPGGVHLSVFCHFNRQLPAGGDTCLPRRRRSLSLLWLAFGFLGMVAADYTQAGGNQIYMYRAKNGTPYFTDARPLGGDYAYIGKYGRPTAIGSCAGVTNAILAARAANYESMIAEQSQAYNVDPHLIRAVMRVESCFDEKAVSRVGAQGLMQLMPATAYSLGVQDSFDPAQNIRGGVQFLSQLLLRYGNDENLALAAYNAGPEAVTRYGGIPPYRETQSYVTRVMSSYKTYRES